MLHALLQATYSTFILASPDSVRLTGLLCRISHRISTDTFLSCTHILTHLKSLILYFMLDIFCLASIHANRCQYQHSDLWQCFLITYTFLSRFFSCMLTFLCLFSIHVALRYESSTLTSKELSSSIFQTLSQGCIFRLTCSHRELTKDHVLTSV